MNIAIIRTKRLYQAVVEGVGTVFQSHDLNEVKEYIAGDSLLTRYTGYGNEPDRAVKYGKLTRCR